MSRNESRSGDDLGHPEEFSIDECPPVMGRGGHNGTLKEMKDRLNKLIRERGLHSAGHFFNHSHRSKRR